MTQLLSSLLRGVRKSTRSSTGEPCVVSERGYPPAAGIREEL